MPYGTAQTLPFSPRECAVMCSDTLKYSNGQVICTPSPSSVSQLDFVMLILNITPHKSTSCAGARCYLALWQTPVKSKKLFSSLFVAIKDVKESASGFQNCIFRFS